MKKSEELALKLTRSGYSVRESAEIAYLEGFADCVVKVIEYLNDSRLIADCKGCYECISELMEKIEQLKEQTE